MDTLEETTVVGKADADEKNLLSPSVQRIMSVLGDKEQTNNAALLSGRSLEIRRTSIQ